MKKLCVILCLLMSQIVLTQTSFTINSNACTGNTYSLTAVTGTNAPLGYTWSAIPIGPLFSSPHSSLSTIQFNVPASYTVKLIVQYGTGNDTATNQVVVDQTPTLSVAQSAFTTCIIDNLSKNSKPVVFSVTGGAYPYNWLPPPPSMSDPHGPQMTVRPTSNSCYTVSSTNAGCTGSSVACLTLAPQFTVALLPEDAVRCIPDSLQLSVVQPSTQPGPYTYAWSSSSPGTIAGSSATVTVFPTSASSYSVEVVDSDGCISAPSVVTVTIEDCTGLDELPFSAFTLTVYPNPNSGSFTVHTSHAKSIQQIEIINQVGQVIFSAINVKPNAGFFAIELNRIDNGIYFLYISVDGERSSSKIVVY